MSRSGWENALSWGASAERSAALKMTVLVQVPAEEVAAWGQLLSPWAVPWWKRPGRNDPWALTASSTQSLAIPPSRPRYRWVFRAICWTSYFFLTVLVTFWICRWRVHSYGSRRQRGAQRASATTDHWIMRCFLRWSTAHRCGSLP